MELWILVLTFVEDGDANATVHASHEAATSELNKFVDANWDSEVCGDIDACSEFEAALRFFEEYSEQYRYSIISSVLPDVLINEQVPKAARPEEIPLSEREIRFASVALQMSDYVQISAELNIPPKEVEDVLIGVAKKLG